MSARRAGARAASAQPQEERRQARRAGRSAPNATLGGAGRATPMAPSTSPPTALRHPSPRRAESRTAPLADLDPLDSSARRGTYFGTYSGYEATALRRSGRTKSSLEGLDVGRAPPRPTSNAPAERNRSRIEARAREMARQQRPGSALAAPRAGSTVPPPGLSLSRSIIAASLACADADDVDLADAVATLPSVFDRIKMRAPPQSEMQRLSSTHLGVLEEEYRHLRR